MLAQLYLKPSISNVPGFFLNKKLNKTYSKTNTCALKSCYKLFAIDPIINQIKHSLIENNTILAVWCWSDISVATHGPNRDYVLPHLVKSGMTIYSMTPDMNTFYSATILEVWSTHGNPGVGWKTGSASFERSSPTESIFNSQWREG